MGVETNSLRGRDLLVPLRMVLGDALAEWVWDRTGSLIRGKHVMSGYGPGSGPWSLVYVTITYPRGTIIYRPESAMVYLPNSNSPCEFVGGSTGYPPNKVIEFAHPDSLQELEAMLKTVCLPIEATYGDLTKAVTFMVVTTAIMIWLFT